MTRILDASSRVSVAIPVYNGGEYLREALSSVLAQGETQVEVVVQDNASSDLTPGILAEMSAADPRVTVRRNAYKVPMAQNWNSAISNVSGTHVMLLSADDLLLPSFLNTALEALRSGVADMVTTNHYFLEGERRYSRKMPLPGGVYSFFPEKVLALNPFSINFTLFTRSALESLKLNGRIFREHLYTCDYDLWLRIALSGLRVLYIPQPHGVYRLHEANLSKKAEKMTRHMALSTLAYRKPLLKFCPWRYRLALLKMILRGFRNFVFRARYDGRLIWLLIRRLCG